MEIIPASHIDHGLSQSVVDLILATFASRDGFFVETIQLPAGQTVPCVLYGPIMGDEPIMDEEVYWLPRGNRVNYSRLIDRPLRQSSQVTVIAGPYGDNFSCVLYTAFGGPLAPKEPNDPTINPEEIEDSKAFWAKHALVCNDHQPAEWPR